MPELTDEEALGRGLAFTSLWDFETTAGSFATVDGVEALGRDLAFATVQELDDELGGILTAEDIEEIKIALRRVANRDSRVARIVPPITVEPTDDANAMAEVSLKLVAQTGERGDHVLQL